MGLGTDISKLYDELCEVSEKQSGRIKTHYHHCPECYEVFLCFMECTIDSEEDGKQFGAHCKCFECEPISGRDEVGNVIEAFSKDWWDRYNGIKRHG